jgi:molybdopterin-containing oxidoreductase family iron-sulfur binding subunit
MKGGEIGLVLVNGANPAFTLPFSREFEEGLSHVPMVVSFSSCPDETSEAAHLILPVHTPLESWGDYSPEKGITGLMQPVTGTLFDTRHLGDILIATGKKIRGEEKFPWKDFYHLLRTTWPNEVWLDALQKGGAWNSEGMPTSLTLDSSFSFAFPLPPAKKHSVEAFHFVAYPTVQFYDGRMANRPWIQELPDPITQVTWGGWVEIHPEKARELAIEKGDLLLVASPYGSLEAPALPIPTVPPDTVAIPLGQGHRAYGRYASGVPADPLNLFPKEVDPSTGTMACEFTVTIKKLGKRHALANTDGSLTQQDRHMVETMAWEDYLKDLAGGVKPEIDLPLPEGFDPKKDFYPPHVHKEYRWCMVVDLDRCIGCGACVVACYAENNVALVGRKRVLQGREMSWLRVQRYFDEKESKARFLVMLCQHCCAAPCESVCPVFAPHHGPDGLNNQIYNRCFGTRFCSQNDPYKVRRFNYFTYTRPRPLDFQLNPDVTVRQKGVMEKCSFCIQRIVEAKMKAREQGRKKVQDGDFTTACAQTCPTNALVFGNLLEPGSRVSRLIKDTRAYQVLRRLNTKPAVIYLKKLTHPLETSEA